MLVHFDDECGFWLDQSLSVVVEVGQASEIRGMKEGDCCCLYVFKHTASNRSIPLFRLYIDPKQAHEISQQLELHARSAAGIHTRRDTETMR